MKRLVGGVSLLVLAAGCGESRVPMLEKPPAAAEPLVIEVATPGFTGEIRLEPAVASTTVLRDALEPNLRAQMVEATVAAQADAEARGPDAVHGAYFYRSTWDGTPVGTRYLSVVGETATFTGGAHALLAIDAFVWDRMTERRLELQDLIVDPTPGGEALQRLAVAVREALVAAKRSKSPEYDPASDSFLQPPGQPDALSPDASSFPNVVLVPAGLRVLFAPYDVGPWAEGKYDLLVPAATVRPLLKPEFAALLDP